MPQRNSKIGFTAKIIIIAFFATVFFVPGSFGRGSLKLYSIANNGVWNSVASWSLSENGTSAGILPQFNDTVIINSSIIQNINFTFSEFGTLEVTSSGLLRGENLDLTFNGSSNLVCSGELKSANINITDKATLSVLAGAKIKVFNSFNITSSANHAVLGELMVVNSFLVGGSASISGNGKIEASVFSGTGTAFNISPLSLIPGGSVISEVNWNGSQNTSWNNPANWFGGLQPNENSNVSILTSSNHPEISETAVCGNLYINSLAKLSVNPTAILEINQNLLVKENGKLLLINTSADKASLIIDGNVNGKIQSQYHVVSGKKALISSPVGMALSGTFINMYLRPYDEASAEWGEYIVPTDAQLQVMQGYELYSLYNETKLFEGTPNNVSKTIAISNSGNGLNLTGNPFPSYIDWEDNDNVAWQRSSIASAIYYPDPSGSGNYAVYLPGGDDAVSINNGTRYIEPMQGFFVKAGKQGTLTVTESSRVRKHTDSKVILKNNSVKFKLADSEGVSDETMFRVSENSTFGFDDNLDAIKIFGNTGAPSIHLESDDDTKYVVSTIPSINSSTEIPLVVECSKAGNFSLSISGSFNFEYRYPVTLEDVELGKFIDLRIDSVYSFYQSPEMNSKRFKIHFNSTEGIDDQNDIVSSIDVLPGEVKISGKSNEVYSVNLFTADGKLINSSKGMLSAGITMSTNDVPSGIYLVQVFNSKSNTTKKFIKK